MQKFSICNHNQPNVFCRNRAPQFVITSHHHHCNKEKNVFAPCIPFLPCVLCSLFPMCPLPLHMYPVPAMFLVPCSLSHVPCPIVIRCGMHAQLLWASAVRNHFQLIKTKTWRLNISFSLVQGGMRLIFLHFLFFLYDYFYTTFI